MIAKIGNKTCYKCFKSFYKLGKKGRIFHVVAAMTACLTIATASFATDVSVDTDQTTTQTVDADGDTLTISSSGKITVESSGITYAVKAGAGVGENNTVTNNGDLFATSTGGKAYGIKFNSSTLENTNIINTGSISATALTSEAYGMILSALKASSINNSGSITVNAGTDAYGIKAAGLDNSSITNSGTIEVSGTDATGIATTGYGMTNASSLENALGGTITVTSTTGAAIGMSALGMGDMYDTSTMVNAGQITVTSTAGGDLAGMAAKLDDTSSVVNSGTIIGTQTGDGDNFGIWITSSENTATITNSGTISLTTSGSGQTAGIWNSGTATITNSGTIEVLNASGVMADNLYAIYTAGALNNSGTLKGEIYAGDTTNSGQIYLPAVTSTITGDFTQTASGTLGITLFSDDDLANTVFSTLSVTGTTTLADGSGIEVDVTTASADQELLIGQTLTGVIQSAGGITVDTDALNITDNSILLDFTATLSSSTSLDLVVEKGMSIYDATLSGGGTGVTGVAECLDTLSGTSDDQISTFISDLNTLSTAEAVASRVQQAAPVTAAQSPTLATQVTNTMSAVVQARQQSVRGFNSGDAMFSDRNIWVKPYAAWIDQDDVDGVSGFTADTLGLGIGTDGEYAPGRRLGLAFFYTQAETETNNTPQASDLDVFNLMLYGSRPLGNPNTNLFFQAGGGLQFTESQRYIQSVDMTAKADYTSKNLYAQVKTTKQFQAAQNLKLVPGASISYTWFYNPSYGETGAGGLSLNVDSFDSHALVAALEGDLIWTLKKDVELMASLSLGYDMMNDSIVVGSSFQGGGTVFQTSGLDNSPMVYSAGIGVARKFTDRFYLDGKYDLEGRGNDFICHMISAKLNWKF